MSGIKNRRGSILLTIDGETKPLPEWCEIHGVKPSCAHLRLNRGWTARDAILTPPGERPEPWTAVENGLPGDNRLVWVVAWTYDLPDVWLASYDPDTGWSINSEGITHWKPARIPDPPPPAMHVRPMQATVDGQGRVTELRPGGECPGCENCDDRHAQRET